jgi:hypothetical protein
MRMRTAVSVLLLVSMGCATVQRGPMQRVLIETDPAGASVELEECGLKDEERTTPVTIFIPRRVKRCSVLLLHDGYEPARVILQRRRAEPVPTGGAAVAEGICDLAECDSLTDLFVAVTVGGLIYGVSKGVDAVAGSNWELEPGSVQITLVPERHAHSEASAEPAP